MFWAMLKKIPDKTVSWTLIGGAEKSPIKPTQLLRSKKGRSARWNANQLLVWMRRRGCSVHYRNGVRPLEKLPRSWNRRGNFNDTAAVVNNDERGGVQQHAVNESTETTASITRSRKNNNDRSSSSSDCEQNNEINYSDQIHKVTISDTNQEGPRSAAIASNNEIATEYWSLQSYAQTISTRDDRESIMDV